MLLFSFLIGLREFFYFCVHVKAFIVLMFCLLFVEDLEIQIFIIFKNNSTIQNTIIFTSCKLQ